jgi:hypothetical protein
LFDQLARHGRLLWDVVSAKLTKFDNLLPKESLARILFSVAGDL